MSGTEFLIDISLFFIDLFHFKYPLKYWSPTSNRNYSAFSGNFRKKDLPKSPEVVRVPNWDDKTEQNRMA